MRPLLISALACLALTACKQDAAAGDPLAAFGHEVEWHVTEIAGQTKLLAGPLLIIIILSMMILPLPPFALDLFFTFNIALSIMVLLVSMFTQKPLDFAAFPAILFPVGLAVGRAVWPPRPA